MARLVASRLALEVVVALDQRPDGLRLAEVAAILRVGPSTAQRALQILVADGFVESSVEAHPHYRLRSHPAAPALVAFAERSLPVEDALDLVCRANPAVEFAGRDARGYLIVRRLLTEPADEAALARALEAVNADRREARPVISYRHDQLRELLAASPRLRVRASALRVVQGSRERSFPQPSRRSGEGEPLGRLHPSLRTPSRRALRAMVRRHHLDRMVVFGSAVRSDFRSGSDVDVLVEPRPGTSLGLDDLLGIREELEAAFDREVEVVSSRFARSGVLERARSEGVVLYA